MTVREMLKKAGTGVSDTAFKRYVLRTILLFLLTVLFAVGGSLLGMFTFGFWLRPLLDRAPVDSSLILCLTGYIFYLFFTLLIAYRLGVRKVKKDKTEVGAYWKADATATLIYVLPSLVLYALTTKSDSNWISGLITYMPFLFLRKLLRFEGLSVLVTAFAASFARTGVFALGRKLWLLRGGYEQYD